MLDQKLIEKLIETAIGMTKMSYAPYSNFKVGAALLAKNGQIFRGCNIENAGYTPSNCAERTAFFKAVSEGVKDFEAIAVVGGQNGVLTELTAPCGVCRQVMMEFCDPKTFQIILAVDKKNYKIMTLEELLPMGFGPANLENMTLSPTLTSILISLPSTMPPGPTSSTSASCGFSFAVPAKMMPLLVVSSASTILITTRSAKGLIFI